MTRARAAEVVRDAGGWVSGTAVANVLRSEGAELNNAYQAIYRAWRDGMIERRGDPRCREYRFVANPSDRVKQVREPVDEVDSVPTGDAIAYVGPVTDRSYGAPRASMGTACTPPDDVIPPAAAALFDHLHRKFYEHFHNVE